MNTVVLSAVRDIDRKEFLFENPVNDIPMDVRRVKLISQSEWKRLKNQLDSNLGETARIEAKKLEIEKIKTQSREMVKKWTNTLLVCSFVYFSRHFVSYHLSILKRIMVKCISSSH
ncbi:unnamed protein product [Schistosoma margrebowiei]|uniref:Uncharacterized protein n=1 Tax=Schistosoma margrebowiei TaxID=48269 RepID=A0A183NA54_9TREM|nr:unnamed protein product [Schistosoma margrebowiei]